MLASGHRQDTDAGGRIRAQAFLDSARGPGAFHPAPAPPLALDVRDQARIRDRSTIMARHLFADRGDAFADEQVMTAKRENYI